MSAPNQFRFMPIGPTADRGDGATPDKLEYEEFYVAYGECFSIWSEVELRLFAIFACLIRSPDYEAMSSSFYSTTGFRSKLDMVDAVVTNSKRVGEEEKKTWATLRQSATRSSKRRNHLAHGTVYFGREASERRKIFVGDPRQPYKRTRLHTHDLRELQESFSALSLELGMFWQRHSAQPVVA
ncbi:hypothetical protein [Variovorax sp. EBFNA2]|uniref:hypothetical protein n=1 Tax=Variovorax sp. EBFNA2 TaxID=3342097 RepID=UPI0029BFC654|nr:hypothetical protein [Variovorax boronicumulans]WPG35169.1 hypothetical protein RZE79_16890 [Variovorax boronicumulans]